MRSVFLGCGVLSLVLSIALSPQARAHPGNTAADGCHYCRTNCDKWGVPWNERHCHGGNEPLLKTSVQPEKKTCSSPMVLVGKKCLSPLNACIEKYGADATVKKDGTCVCRDGYQWNVEKTRCVFVNPSKPRKASESRAARKSAAVSKLRSTKAR